MNCTQIRHGGKYLQKNEIIENGFENVAYTKVENKIKRIIRNLSVQKCVILIYKKLSQSFRVFQHPLLFPNGTSIIQRKSQKNTMDKY